IKEIQLDREVFEVAAYVTPPENTAKGVMHGIPERDTDQSIHDNLVGTRNPTILQARPRHGSYKIHSHPVQRKLSRVLGEIRAHGSPVPPTQEEGRSLRAMRKSRASYRRMPASRREKM
ncbi:hypothetical protein HPB47_028092, partial [Ixodes persulcatus]